MQEPDNVIRLPREWIGPLDELVPMGRASTKAASGSSVQAPAKVADGADAEDFWGGDGTWNVGFDETQAAPATEPAGAPDRLRSSLGTAGIRQTLSGRLAIASLLVLVMLVAARIALDHGGARSSAQAGRADAPNGQFVERLTPAVEGLAALVPTVTAVAHRAAAGSGSTAGAHRPHARAKASVRPRRHAVTTATPLVSRHGSAVAPASSAAPAASSGSAQTPYVSQAPSSASGGSESNGSPQVSSVQRPAASSTPSTPAGLGSCISNC